MPVDSAPTATTRAHSPARVAGASWSQCAGVSALIAVPDAVTTVRSGSTDTCLAPSLLASSAP